MDDSSFTTELPRIWVRYLLKKQTLKRKCGINWTVSGNRMAIDGLAQPGNMTKGIEGLPFKEFSCHLEKNGKRISLSPK